MTSQEEANQLIELWRLQARVGIKPDRRLLPERKSDDQFSRDLEIIRQVMERA